MSMKQGDVSGAWLLLSVLVTPLANGALDAGGPITHVYDVGRVV
jgi:hypothetical protein